MLNRSRGAVLTLDDGPGENAGSVSTTMRSRFSVRAALMALLVTVPVVRAEEPEPYHYEPLNFIPSKIGSLPPFTASELSLNNSSAKPVEASVRLRFAERILRVKSSYLDRDLIADPFLGTKRKRNIFSLSGSSDLAGKLLKSETEFGFNALDRGAAQSLGRDTAKMFRFALNGDWQAYKYGGEYRSVDKGFMHFKGGESGRSEVSGRIWAERSIGPIHLKTTLSQLWENLNESAETPRETRSSVLSLTHKKGAWQTSFASGYSRRADRFQGGTAAEVISHEFRAVYQPIKDLKLIPLIQYSSDHNRSSEVRTATPSTSLTLTYASWRNVLNFAAGTSFKWARTSDRLTDQRDLNSSAKVIWNLGEPFSGRKTLTWEVIYTNHRDFVARANSNRRISIKLALTIHRF